MRPCSISSGDSLVFRVAPDYETDPHSYQVEVTAYDGINAAVKLITVDVTNIPGITITGTSHNDTINATSTVAGQSFPTDGEDVINGDGGRDTIGGLAGNDTLNGGKGADTLMGGAGSDTYIVDNAMDVVDETGTNGIDRVQSSITFSLSDATHAKGDIENLTLIGTSAINGTGNALDNVITGNSGDNILAGLAGADSLDGGLGIDTATYAASAAAVRVSLAAGTASGGDAEGDTLFNFESLTGSNFDDILEGNAGANVLVGGAGIDTVSYANATVGVTVNLGTMSAQNTGGAGSDTLSGFENLTGSQFNDSLTGTNAANVSLGLPATTRSMAARVTTR
jgi:Ca2+-binding RTX toxin-like protein